MLAGGQAFLSACVAFSLEAACQKLCILYMHQLNWKVLSDCTVYTTVICLFKSASYTQVYVTERVQSGYTVVVAEDNPIQKYILHEYLDSFQLFQFDSKISNSDLPLSCLIGRSRRTVSDVITTPVV